MDIFAVLFWIVYVVRSLSGVIAIVYAVNIELGLCLATITGCRINSLLASFAPICNSSSVTESLSLNSFS